MSSRNSIGGVSNLRALFETKTSDDRPASPPSRGRSPAASDASRQSRPVSKVRASFVAVERTGSGEEGQHWGLRKASDVSKMAEVKRGLENGSSMNGPTETHGHDSHLAGPSNERDLPQPMRADIERPNGSLGEILKGSAFEMSPDGKPQSQTGKDARRTTAQSTPVQPKNAKNTPNGTKSLEKPSRTPSKTLTLESKKSDASPSNGMLRADKSNPSLNTNTIKTSPARQASLSKPLSSSPTSPRSPKTPRTPTSAGRAKAVTSKAEKTPAKESVRKASADTEPAKGSASQEQVSKSSPSPTMTKSDPRAEAGVSNSEGSPSKGIEPAKQTKPSTDLSESTSNDVAGTAERPLDAVKTSSSSDKQSDPASQAEPFKKPTNRASGRASHATRHSTNSARNTEMQNGRKSSPTFQRGSGSISAAVSAPTVASTARSHGGPSVTRKNTVSKPDRPTAGRLSGAAAPAAKRQSRASFSTQSSLQNDLPKPRSSISKKAPDEGFLSRMMRPTASSAQKAHEKLHPSSPPQGKKSAPKSTARNNARRSLARSEEDKENSHQVEQEASERAPSTDLRQGGPNGEMEAESQPLRDITPAPDSPPPIPGDAELGVVSASGG